MLATRVFQKLTRVAQGLRELSLRRRASTFDLGDTVTAECKY